MRILKIEMENLNSLKGFWSINLEDAAYRRNHDLFVISGPTGAGKTTILDAITLALYGRTPRQDSLAGSNEIMTRRTASCMARVCYRCMGGRFVSEFSQKKARGKADGNLQGAECRITDADSGSVLYAGKAKGLAEMTEQIVKLSYRQFCSSIMLAQGEFDSFLNGGGNDADKARARASILAKLTGTERFKKIGAQVGIRAGEAAAAFRDAQLRLQEQGRGLLDEQQELELKERLARLEEQQRQDEAALKDVSDALLWFRQYGECGARLEASRSARRAFEAEREAFGGAVVTLDRMERARACKADYARLTHLRGSREADRTAQARVLGQLAGLGRSLAAAGARVQEADSGCRAQDEEALRLRPLWKRLRETDARLKLARQSEDAARIREEESRMRLDAALSGRAAVQAQLAELGGRLEEAEGYLAGHAGDGELPSVMSGLAELAEHCCARFDKLEKLEGGLLRARGERDRLLARKEAEEAALARAEERLKALVSTEYASVARIIRGGLEAGKPCPVCGATEHPLAASPVAGHSEGQGGDPGREAALSAGERNLGADILSLGGEIDRAKKAVQDGEKEAVGQEQLIELYERDLADLRQEQEDGKLRICALLKDCRFSPQSLEALGAAGTKAAFRSSCAAFQSALGGRLQAFEAKRSLKTELEKRMQGLRGSLEATDVDNLQKVFDSDRKGSLLEGQKRAAVEDERRRLFGDKDADAEEEAFDRAAAALRKEQDAARAALNELQKQKAACEGMLSELEGRLADTAGQLEGAEEAFLSALRRSGISGEEEYALFLRDEDRYEDLRSRREELKELDTRTQTALDTCRKALEDCLERKPPAFGTDALDAASLEERRRDLSDRNAAALEQIGRIKQSLAADGQRKGELEKLRAAYDAAREENEKWLGMRQLVGKQDGSDLEVFVQALAFKSLLSRANRYLLDITGRYCLVQEAGGVDFKIHDVNFADERDDRPVSNMSGGEKFIISLSLALGIAELASRSVSVDSLFLDEGFGTLSGKPLTQAVDALKQLQRSGKMLGIITHVDAVIKEFDQRIEVLPVSNGFSELRGSGISREKARAPRAAAPEEGKRPHRRRQERLPPQGELFA